MNEFQKNINWKNIKEDNSSIFIPPIKYGKVIKVHSGDSFTIITQISFFHEIIETASIYHFNIYLDGVLAPKTISIINNDPAKLSKDALKKLIYGNIVELCDISTDKYGKLYANVFIDNIHINDWLLKNNFVIKSKNGKNRRMTDLDSYFHEKIKRIPDLDSNFNDKIKSILPNINSTSTIDILLESSSSKKIENFILPKLSNDENRLNSFSSSSNIQSHCFLSHN
jgi:endonuclease YncB( thermonuclease family)